MTSIDVHYMASKSCKSKPNKRCTEKWTLYTKFQLGNNYMSDKNAWGKHKKCEKFMKTFVKMKRFVSVRKKKFHQFDFLAYFFREKNGRILETVEAFRISKKYVILSESFLCGVWWIDFFELLTSTFTHFSIVWKTSIYLWFYCILRHFLFIPFATNM